MELLPDFLLILRRFNETIVKPKGVGIIHLFSGPKTKKGMRYSIIFLVCLFSFGFTAKAQYFNFAGKPEVSVLTCAPGKAVYAKFGHTAIRINDGQGLDLVFNYGVFDFNTPGFLLKFLRGRTDYMLGVYPTASFIAEYKERNSTVWEQNLNLDTLQTQKLIRLLNTNYIPENRFYRYNFAFDNCATRPREVIRDALDGVIVTREIISGDSYRDLINYYIEDSPWLYVGINVLFGIDADQPVRNSGELFLPELMRNNLQYAKVRSNSDLNAEKKLVTSISELVTAEPEPVKSKLSIIFHPMFFFLILLFMGIYLTFKTEKRNKTSKVFDTLLFASTGMAGLILFFFSNFSVHPFVDNNLNLLWLNPLNLIVALFIWSTRFRRLTFFYLVLYVLSILVYGGITAWMSYNVVFSLLPLIVLLLIRSFRRVKRLLHKLTVPTDKGFKWI